MVFYLRCILRGGATMRGPGVAPEARARPAEGWGVGVAGRGLGRAGEAGARRRPDRAGAGPPRGPGRPPAPPRGTAGARGARRSRPHDPTERQLSRAGCRPCPGLASHGWRAFHA